MYGGTHFQESESTSFNSVPYFHPSPRLATFAVSSVFPIISLSLLSFLPMCYYQQGTIYEFLFASSFKSIILLMLSTLLPLKLF